MIITDGLLASIKQNEGTKLYQQKLGYFKANKFQLYQDHLMNWTIGYGHLVPAKEIRKFKLGITEQQADQLLLDDVGVAAAAAMKWISTSDVELQQLLTEMVFQLGISRAMKFRKFKAAVEAGSYAQAAMELRNSLWFKQTPNRVELHISRLQKK